MLKIIRRIEPTHKVGPKTASLLLGEFGSLENILANANSIQKPSIRESILRNAHRLRINYKLIKLRNVEPLPFVIDELEYDYTEITTNEVLKNIGLK